MPDVRMHNIYYWYYATQVLHNYTGYEWDTWNRAMRKLLVGTQTERRDAAPTAVGTRTIRPRTSGAARAAATWRRALSCLTLEIYYRYLPLYKVDAEDNNAGPAPAADRRRQGFQARQGRQRRQGREGLQGCEEKAIEESPSKSPAK